jgi:thymidylate synthase (FAD)
MNLKMRLTKECNMLKLVLEPSVYIVGAQLVDDDALWQFLHDHTDDGLWHSDTEVSSQELVEVAGRVCYMSFDKPRPGGNRKYIEHILEVGHGSVLEHGVFNFIITGVDRSFSHELVRHRAGWGYSQLSQRYVDESDCSFVVPPALQAEVNAYLAWKESGGNDSPVGAAAIGQDWYREVENDLAAYRRTSDYLFGKYANITDKTARRKAAREAARSLLPGCTETKLFCTANVRALRHFFEMRASAAADHAMSIVAVKLLRALQGKASNIFGDYQITRTPEGREVAMTPYRKV